MEEQIAEAWSRRLACELHIIYHIEYLIKKVLYRIRWSIIYRELSQTDPEDLLSDFLTYVWEKRRVHWRRRAKVWRGPIQKSSMEWRLYDFLRIKTGYRNDRARQDRNPDLELVRLMSIHEEVGDNDDYTVLDQMMTPLPEPHKAVEDQDLKEWVEGVIIEAATNGRFHRNKADIYIRHRLRGDRLKEIGESYGLSESRMSQISKEMHEVVCDMLRNCYQEAPNGYVFQKPRNTSKGKEEKKEKKGRSRDDKRSKRKTAEGE